MTDVSGQTVLIVEDEPLIRFAVADVARGIGFNVRKTPAAAASLNIREHIDCITLVVTDIRMPGKTDGLMLSDIINMRWPKIRILVTSAYPPVDLTQQPGRDWESMFLQRFNIKWCGAKRC